MSDQSAGANGEQVLRHTKPAAEVEEKGQLRPQYDSSWAVVIGINNYQHLQPLAYAVNDAVGMADLLTTKLGFGREQVLVILDPPPETPSLHYDLTGSDASKAAIEELLFTTLPEKAGRDDRVLVFFAGHGESRDLPTGGHKGYLVPADGQPGKWHKLIQMDDVIEAGDLLAAKHVFYLIDACFSGLAVARSGIQPSRFETDMLTSRARQALTVGNARQAVADKGPRGHSLFTSFVLQGLGGEAAQESSQVITASDLMLYVRNRVAKRYRSKQTPDFGSLAGHESGGDFLFVLPPTRQPVVDLTQWVTIRMTRGAECTAMALVTAIETGLARQGVKVRLSATDLYTRAKQHDEADLAEGTWLRPVLYVADFFGVPVETASDTGTEKARYKARSFGLSSMDEVALHLGQGRPIVAACVISDLESWHAAKNGEIPMPAKNGQLVGKHVITIVKYDPNEDVFVFANNWGDKWGQDGFGSMTGEVARVRLRADQIWAVEVRL